MTPSAAAEQIQAKARSLGYEKCGLIRVDELGGYGNKLTERIERFPSDRPFLERLYPLGAVGDQWPWARSVLILARAYNHYRLPEVLRDRVAACYVLGGLSLDGSPENRASRALGRFLGELNIRAEVDRRGGLAAMRWAALRAGLGLVRQNNFFYTESGSWVSLEIWLLDRELELRETSPLKPCPPDCDRCRQACPTAALTGPYEMRPTVCVTFLTAFGDGRLNLSPLSPALGERVYGCDACQKACPFNQKPLLVPQTDYPGLDELSPWLSPPALIERSYDELRARLAEQFWYIRPDQLWRWKVNALNAMKNSGRPEYRPWLEKALVDPAQEVRDMAAWALAGSL